METSFLSVREAVAYYLMRRVAMFRTFRTRVGGLGIAGVSHKPQYLGQDVVMKIPDGLSEAERRAWEGFPAGANVEFSTGDAAEDDPANGRGWGPERQVRAEVLARLLCGEVPVQPGEIGSVRLVGARIIGDLLLQDTNVQHSLWLERCHMTGWIDLTMATTRSLQLDNCYLGSIRMIGTKMAGELSLRGSHIRGEKEPALQSDMATVFWQRAM